LIVGTPYLSNLHYSGIRALGSDFVRSLKDAGSHAGHLAVTIHGVGYGLEIPEAFRAQLLGMVNAIELGDYPASLEKITFVEFQEYTASILINQLEQLKRNHPSIKFSKSRK